MWDGRFQLSHHLFFFHFLFPSYCFFALWCGLALFLTSLASMSSFSSCCCAFLVLAFLVFPFVTTATPFFFRGFASFFLRGSGSKGSCLSLNYTVELFITFHLRIVEWWGSWSRLTWLTLKWFFSSYGYICFSCLCTVTSCPKLTIAKKNSAMSIATEYLLN